MVSHENFFVEIGQIEFDYRPSTSLRANHKPEPFWSCLAAIEVHFSQPVSIGTLNANVSLSRDATGDHARRHLILKKVDRTFQQLTFTAAPPGICNYKVTGLANYKYFKIDGDVRSLNNQALGEALIYEITYPPNDARHRTAQTTLCQDDKCSTKPISTKPTFPTCQSGQTSDQCLSTKPEDLNRALIALEDWIDVEEQRESERQYSCSRSCFVKTPLAGTILKQANYVTKHKQEVYDNLYGSSDLVYALRRAAKFVELLFAPKGLTTITLQRLNTTKDAKAVGATDVHYNGQNADIAYLLTNDGKHVDWERNFWFLYGIHMSSLAGASISAYSDYYMVMAQKAYRQGLISLSAANRMKRVQRDFNVNHDSHIHINIKSLTRHNQRPVQRRFLDSDNGMNCYDYSNDTLSTYSGLSPGYFNYCDESRNSNCVESYISLDSTRRCLSDPAPQPRLRCAEEDIPVSCQ
jgi:hypothetical protein